MGFYGLHKWLQKPQVKHLGTYYRYWEPEKLSRAEIFSYTWYFPVLLLLWTAALLSLLASTCWKFVSEAENRQFASTSVDP
jgi:hypothetical protein